MKKHILLIAITLFTTNLFAQSSGFTGKVLQTMDAGGYTYVEMDTGKAKLWIAGPKTEIKKGDEINTPIGFEMKDFKSNALDRTFPSIFFVGGINQGKGDVKQALPPGHPPMDKKHTHPGVADAIDAHNIGKKIPSPVTNLKGIAKAPNGFTVHELITDGKKKHANKNVRVRARVVKVNKGIMGRNWYHLRDGSGEDGQADLTVTSKEVAALGDLVLAEGNLAIDQDFGLGYKYPVLLEKAKLGIEK